MVETTAPNRSIRTVALCASVAGATGIIANLLLVAMFVQLGLRAGEPGDGIPFGSANDLTGSVAAAFMIPVALSLSGRLPRRRAAGVTQAAGITALALLTIGGPLLVLGVLPFGAATLIAVGAYVVLGLWMLLVNRWFIRSGTVWIRVARFGVFVGAGTLAGYGIVGLLLPWMSWPQLVVFGAGLVIGLPAWLGIPVWFLLLGRYFGRS